MALCPEDVSQIRLGKLSPFTCASNFSAADFVYVSWSRRIDFLRNLREFFGATFKIEPDTSTHTVLLTCLGIGYKNLAKKMY
jgi:RNA 3'-terminal phosphate cyclase-like protein